MRIGDALRLSPEESSDLFYAALLKDAGCSANAERVYQMFGGPERALEMAAQRRGRWFDPELVDCLQAISSPALWASLEAADERLDQIATAFAWVIDAKSSFTFEHSDRVSSIALAMAERLGFSAAEQTRLRRAALLHDIGKLAVPNAILDKPGKLTPAEWAIVKQHPEHTLNVLRRVPIFEELAEDAANHHERLDGRGYFRGLTAAQLTPTARVLAVADVADALMSARPYREAMPIDQVLGLIEQGRATEFCPDCVDVLGVTLAAAA